jgi:6-phosphogluconolactonase
MDLISIDERRDLICPGDRSATLQFCIQHFLTIGQEAIALRGAFHVALSGGSTPKAIYAGLTEPRYRKQLTWEKVHLYWSDERSVPPYHPDSNYHMAMEAGFNQLHLPPENIHRMQAEGDVEVGAWAYEKLIQTHIPGACFDLLTLGLGEDGHTASLFPHTHGLHAENRLVIGNYVPAKDTWRMSLTFDCINRAAHSVVYVLGKEKAAILSKVLSPPFTPDDLPAQRLGSATHKALFIADQESFPM